MKKFKLAKKLNKKIDLPAIPGIPLTSVNPVALADVMFRKDKRTELFLSLETDKRIDMLRSVTKTVRSDLL